MSKNMLLLLKFVDFLYSLLSYIWMDIIQSRNKILFEILKCPFCLLAVYTGFVHCIVMPLKTCPNKLGTRESTNQIKRVLCDQLPGNQPKTPRTSACKRYIYGSSAPATWSIGEEASPSKNCTACFMVYLAIGSRMSRTTTSIAAAF